MKTINEPRVIDPKDVQIMLPYARQIAAIDGLAMSADDASIAGLAFAQANFERKLSGWCQCENVNTLAFPQVYFNELLTGHHGWICSKCRRTTQTG